MVEYRLTKTNVSRYVYFCNVLIQFYVYMDTFRDQKIAHTYQFLPTDFHRPLAKTLRRYGPKDVFCISNGAKSHLPRHLVTSQLISDHLKEWVNCTGNWIYTSKDVERTVGFSNYNHGITEIQAASLAYISGYYTVTSTSQEPVLCDGNSEDQFLRPLNNTGMSDKINSP